MFKILTTASLLFASFSIRFDVAHEQSWSPANNLNSDQQAWDKFFKDSIGAIGDSAVQEVSTSGGKISIRYLDTTGTNGEVDAWEVTGNGDNNNKQVDKVLQVKTIPDPKNPGLSTVTKTTFQRQNLLDVAKATYA
jgi:hypothetical protein